MNNNHLMSTPYQNYTKTYFNVKKYPRTPAGLYQEANRKFNIAEYIPKPELTPNKYIFTKVNPINSSNHIFMKDKPNGGEAF